MQEWGSYSSLQFSEEILLGELVGELLTPLHTSSIPQKVLWAHSPNLTNVPVLL